MAGLTVLQRPDATDINIAFDDDSDATATKNIDNGPTTLYDVTLKTANAAVSYFSMWDDADPVVGTDGQHFQIPLPATDEVTISFVGGFPFLVGLSWATTTLGGTAAAVSPVTPIDVLACTNGGN